MRELKARLQILIGKTLTEKEITYIINEYKHQYKRDLFYLDKLKRTRELEVNKISGALKQTINSHGPITKELIGSATKRIWGGLISHKKRPLTLLEKIKRFFGI